jgi:hypothetical protein
MKPLALAAFLILWLFYARAQRPYWQQQLEYRVTVTLNDSSHTLEGFLRLDYTNHSPDTLTYIWFHLWQNAYKNDRTAFSEQQLENGNTAFYFSKQEARGYTNRIDFRVDGKLARMEDHPEYSDVVRLMLPKPLAPGGKTQITTPFHVKLSDTWSRSGHEGQSYQVTQWYPKPAVYDSRGWHEMPYLDQGEFFSEFADYEVEITVPVAYVVAATGRLLNTSETNWLTSRPPPKAEKKIKSHKGLKSATKPTHHAEPRHGGELKTLVYRQSMVHDFAWFADKRFVVKLDSLKLPSGKTVSTGIYHLAENGHIWDSATGYLKNALALHSKWLGEYPYDHVSVVEGKQGFNGGMEYPTITILHGATSQEELDQLIFHETGHNWLQGTLATNEREYPWMDEGMNTYYDNRYLRLKQKSISAGKNNMMPDERELQKLFYSTLESIHLDQPIQTPSTAFTKLNYQAIGYFKAATWLEKLEQTLGQDNFDVCMQTYFQRWKFRHPYPEDFRKVAEETGGKPLDSLFAFLDQTGPMEKQPRGPIKPALLYSIKNTDRYQYVFFSPMVGYNYYDGFMAGMVVHNYALPLPRFRFLLSPLYGFKSQSVNAIGHAGYTIFPRSMFQQVELSFAAASFTENELKDDYGRNTRLRFTKLVPGIRFELKEKNPRNNRLRFISLRSFLMGEDQFRFETDTVSGLTAVSKERAGFSLTRLNLVWDQYRALYPYRGELQVELGKDFGRFVFTGRYFFNYTGRGGVQARIFAGKFFYLCGKNVNKEISTDRFHLNMTGPKGYEDYTYSNYFAGRNEFEGIFSQQIMNRDGFFKVRTDLLSSKVGKTDNWLTALNLTADIPDRFNPLSVLPLKIPLKFFADAGTYAEVWKKESQEPRLVFDAGIQVSLLRSMLNIYVPLLYSKVYQDYFKSTPGNDFFQRISFSIDLQHISLRKWLNEDFK